MDESAQQAVQVGVNITIFVIALTISIRLLMGVRDVANRAFEYDASIPTGSKVVTVSENDRRLISGNELLVYYANYMTDLNNQRTYRYIIKIVDGENTLTAEGSEIVENIDLEAKFEHIDLSKNYEVITEKYDKENNILEITLKSVE